MIANEDLAFLARHYPDFAPILDWPRLGNLFAAYDNSAAAARRHSRRAGVLAIATGFLSLSIAAVVPLADECNKLDPGAQLRTQAVLGAMAALLVALSIVIGHTQVLKGEGNIRWLSNRF